MHRLLLPVFTALALVAGACGDDDERTAPTTTAESTTTTSPDVSTTTAPPTDAWPRCESPEGFSVSYPDGWSTNDGTVVAECSMFDPEPFSVPDGTDARVAAVSAYVDEVPFNEVAAPGDESDRAVTTVDGHQAVRLADPGGELYGDDTESTRYVIDLALGLDDGDGTLFVDTIDLDGFDYEANVEILDRMVRTIDLDEVPPAENADGPEPGVVARYEGAAPWTANLSAEADEPCVTAPATDEGTTNCFTEPGADALRFADHSGDLFSATAGVAGRDVFRVDVATDSGTFSYLPVAPGAVHDGALDGVRGWAVPVALTGVRQLSWSDLDGTQLGARTVDEENDVEPVGAFRSAPVSTDDFPASGAPSLLTDVRVAGHDGFDRIVFEFGERGDDMSYSVERVESVSEPSGEEVDVDGDVTLRITMAPASGVDLSGQEPRVIYDGPRRIDPSSTSVVEELAGAEDFESTLTWAVGLSAEHDVAATLLNEPARLVVDISSG